LFTSGKRFTARHPLRFPEHQLLLFCFSPGNWANLVNNMLFSKSFILHLLPISAERVSVLRPSAPQTGMGSLLPESTCRQDVEEAGVLPVTLLPGAAAARCE